LEAKPGDLRTVLRALYDRFGALADDGGEVKITPL